MRLGVPFLQKSLVSPFARPCTAQLLNRKIDGATYFLLLNFGYCRDREKLAKKCLPFCSMVSSNGNIAFRELAEQSLIQIFCGRKKRFYTLLLPSTHAYQDLSQADGGNDAE